MLDGIELSKNLRKMANDEPYIPLYRRV